MVVTVVVDLVVGTGQDKDLSALIIAVSIGKLMMQDILYFHLQLKHGLPQLPKTNQQWLAC